MHIVILATGKKRTPYDEQIAEYSKRIVRPFSIETTVLDSAGTEDPTLAIARENAKVLDKIMPSDYVIALDETGRTMTTEQFARHIEQLHNESARQVVFVVGGAYGLNDTVRSRANMVLRLSSFVFPHELARLVLTEQLYRVTNIIGGGKYHH